MRNINFHNTSTYNTPVMLIQKNYNAQIFALIEIKKSKLEISFCGSIILGEKTYTWITYQNMGDLLVQNIYRYPTFIKELNIV